MPLRRISHRRPAPHARPPRHIAEALEPRTLLANVTLPLPAGANPSDLVYDPGRNVLYVSTGGAIERYDVAAGRMLEPIRSAELAGGFDVTADGSTIYSASRRYNELLKIDVATGASTFIPFQLNPGEAGANDLIIPANGKVLFSLADVNGYGSTLREYNPATGAVAVRSDLFGGINGGKISRSPNRSTAVFLVWEGGFSNRGPVRVYDSGADSIIASHDTFTQINPSQAGFTKNGSQFAIHSAPGSKVYDRANLFAPRQSLPQVDGAMIFDPTQPVFYGVNTATDQFIAYDTATWQEKFQFPVGQDVGGTGANAISDDGSKIFLLTGPGVRVIDVPRATGEAYDFRGGNFSTFVRRGVASTFTLDVRDPAGLPATNYRGTVRFTSDDPAAQLPADYTFTAADAGKHTFTLTLNTPGTRSISVRDVNNSTLALTQSGVTVHAGQTTFVPVPDGQELIYDPTRNTLYVTTSAGALHRYALGDETLQSPFQVGVNLSGGDVTTDGNTLYIAEAEPRPGLNTQYGRIRKVNATSGAVTTLEFPLLGNERAVADLAITANGKAIFTTSAYSSMSMYARQINLATDAITTRTDAGMISGADGYIGYDIRVARGPDRRRLVFQPRGGGPLAGPYESDTDTFVRPGFGSGGLPAAISRDSSLMAFQYGGTVITDARGITLTKFAEPAPFSYDPAPHSSGMVFDPIRDVFYAVHGAAGQVVAYDANTWREKYRIPLGQPVAFADRVGPGQMTASADGRKLFLLTATGVRVIDTRQPDGQPATYEVSGFREFGPAAMPGSFTVTVRDAAGDPATNFRGTILFTSTDPAATLPAPYTFTAADNGTKTFTATFATPGAHQIRVALAGNPSQVLATQAGIVVHNGIVSLIPQAAPRDIVYDPGRDLLYITTASGKVLRYDPATKALLSPLDAGYRIAGADLSPDGKSLFVGADIYGIRGGIIRRFDLTGANPGPYTTIPVGANPAEPGVLDVAVASNGTGLYTTRWRTSDSGFGMFGQFDTATGVARGRINEIMRYNTSIAASADRSAVLVVDANQWTEGYVRLYDPANPDAYLVPAVSSEFTYPVVGAANRNGSLFVVPGRNSTVYDRALNVVRKLPAFWGGAAFDPSRDLFYGVDHEARQIVAYETDGWRELYRIPVTGLPHMTPTWHMNNGMATLSDDGRLLFLTAHGSGVHIIGLPDPPVPGVASANVFYNNSAFDRSDPAANADDDNAIATDKHPLRPGQPVTAANYTSYTKGLNGLMIDLVGLDPFADPTAADFAFHTGTDGDAATWQAAPDPAVSVRRGAGASGSARVTFTWPDGAIRNTWLRVTVRPTAAGTPGGSGVFSFGNLVGDTGPGSPTQPAKVDAADLTRTRAAQSPRRVSLASPFDHNRDGYVNAPDLAGVRGNLFNTLAGPDPALPASPASAPRVLPRRSAYESAATALLRDA